MVNLKAFLIGICLFLLGHVLAWFQLNSQFFNEWFKNNSLILVLFGIPISYTYLYATKYAYIGFGELVWPGRFVGFAIGMIVFGICTATILGEGITIKTGISLTLALALVCVQIFWK